MDRVCVGCGKIMTKMGERYELATNDGLAFVCKDCAREVGIKNMFAASIVTKGKFLEKYVKLHPECQSKLDDTMAYRERKKTRLTKRNCGYEKKECREESDSIKKSRMQEKRAEKMYM